MVPGRFEIRIRPFQSFYAVFPEKKLQVGIDPTADGNAVGKILGRAHDEG
jgi:hypothetical protein